MILCPRQEPEQTCDARYGYDAGSNCGKALLTGARRHEGCPSRRSCVYSFADVRVSRRRVGNIRCMTAPTPYLHFPGTAREALMFYGDVFGCAVQLHTFAEFNRTDGP